MLTFQIIAITFSILLLIFAIILSLIQDSRHRSTEIILKNLFYDFYKEANLYVEFPESIESPILYLQKQINSINIAKYSLQKISDSYLSDSYLVDCLEKWVCNLQRISTNMAIKENRALKSELKQMQEPVEEEKS